MKRIFLALAMMLAPVAAFAEGAVHKVAIHVNQNDPKVMNMALNNVNNLMKYYASQGDTAEVEVVAYGPGLQMLVAGKSPVADRIVAMSMENEGLKFSACGNTHRAMSIKAGVEVALLDEARIVPSGVVRLVELQQGGYAYVRP